VGSVWVRRSVTVVVVVVVEILAGKSLQIDYVRDTDSFVGKMQRQKGKGQKGKGHFPRVRGRAKRSQKATKGAKKLPTTKTADG
jgi:hypothetical protein